jgi:hypothetical protein
MGTNLPWTTPPQEDAVRWFWGGKAEARLPDQTGSHAASVRFARRRGEEERADMLFRPRVTTN